eukprot:s1061_g14.t1
MLLRSWVLENPSQIPVKSQVFLHEIRPCGPRRHASKTMPREGSSSVRAVVRLRPLLPFEVDAGHESCCQVADDRSILVRVGPSTGHQWRKYVFDACLPDDRSQKQVFQDSGVVYLLDEALAGYAATVLAYGQTGSGKTYTMMGRSVSAERNNADEVKKSDGMIMRAARRLFRHIGEMSNARVTVTASFAEIFNAPGAVNECICDLLNPDAGNLQVRFSQKHGFFISDLAVMECTSIGDVRSVLEAGMANRRVSAHALNRESSRTHALFALHIDCEKFAEDDASSSPTRTYGKVTFVDLVGDLKFMVSLLDELKGQGESEGTSGQSLLDFVSEAIVWEEVMSVRCHEKRLELHREAQDLHDALNAAKGVCLVEAETSCQKIMGTARKAHGNLIQESTSPVVDHSVDRLKLRVQRIMKEAKETSEEVAKAKGELKQQMEWFSAKPNISSQDWLSSWVHFLDLLSGAILRIKLPAELPKPQPAMQAARQELKDVTNSCAVATSKPKTMETKAAMQLDDDERIEVLLARMAQTAVPPSDATPKPAATRVEVKTSRPIFSVQNSMQARQFIAFHQGSWRTNSTASREQKALLSCHGMGVDNAGQLWYWLSFAGDALKGGNTAACSGTIFHPLGDSVQYVVLDEGGLVVKQGPGELCLSGPMVTPGYWPPDTADTADTDAWMTDTSGRRFFRTRDVVEVMPEGGFIYKGRKDRSTKIQGQWVDLDALEQRVQDLDGIKEACVIETDGSLHSFVVLDCYRAADLLRCMENLRRVRQMMPWQSCVKVRPKLPRNENGKTDFRALKTQLAAHKALRGAADAADALRLSLTCRQHGTLAIFAFLVALCGEMVAVRLVHGGPWQRRKVRWLGPLSMAYAWLALAHFSEIKNSILEKAPFSRMGLLLLLHLLPSPAALHLRRALAVLGLWLANSGRRIMAWPLVFWFGVGTLSPHVSLFFIGSTSTLSVGL